MIIQLRALSNKQAQLRQVLRSYLVRHNISAELSIRVKTFLEESFAHIRDEEDDSVLQSLPQDILMDIRIEALTPLLTSCGPLRFIRMEYPRASRLIYYDAVVTMNMDVGAVVFAPGDVCDRQFFVENGNLL